MTQVFAKINKKQRGLLWSYVHSDTVVFCGYNGLYKTASVAKHKANNYVINDCIEHDGFRARYARGGSYFFSYAFLYRNTEDNMIHLRYHTHANVYDFPLVSAQHYFKTHELTEDGEYHV